jgi:hypothetical protein
MDRILKTKEIFKIAAFGANLKQRRPLSATE